MTDAIKKKHADNLARIAALFDDKVTMTDELVKHMTGLIAAGLDRIEALTAERDKYESAWMTAEGKLADAMEGLEKCQAELDEYSRQEYPLDHTVHERYRQRDYDANPARITLAALKGESHE